MKYIFFGILIFVFYIAIKGLRFLNQVKKAVDKSTSSQYKNEKRSSGSSSANRSYDKKDVVDVDFIEIKEDKSKS